MLPTFALCATTLLLADSRKPGDPVYEFAETPTFIDNFDPGWEQNQKDWAVATWTQNKTKMSKERCQTNGEGMLVQTVLPKLPGEGGSMQTKAEFGYGRWVARVKPSSVPGVLNSIFTMDWDDKKQPGTNGKGRHGEIDIEFLTHTFSKNNGQVHLALHLADDKGNHHPNIYKADPELGFNPSDDFHEWGFDILPDRVEWHVDGKVLDVWHYTNGIKVDEDYEFFMNSWTMKKWIEGPPPEKADYYIDWVKFYPLKK